jgi:putative chitinase
MGVAISETLLRKMWPHGDAKVPGLVAGIAASSERVFAQNGITSWLTVAHIMAQMSHECNAGLEVVENLNYRAEQLSRQWPSHFTPAQATRMAHNPRAIADQAYNGRMGNRVGSDDGWNYRGRGGPQTTGEQGYAKLAKKTGLPLLQNPDLENDPHNFLECMVADFIICGCLPFCAPRPGLPLGDIHGVTQHLNGGQIGASMRKAWFDRWWAALKGFANAPAPQRMVAPAALLSSDAAAGDQVAADAPDLAPVDEPAIASATLVDDGVLRYGAEGFEVKALQEKLVSLGYMVGEIDGEFKGGTRAAVLAFQADNLIATTGEVDAATRAMLKTAPPKPIAEKRSNATAADLRAAGAPEVATGDRLTFWGKGLALLGLGTGGAQGAGKVRLLDSVSGAADQLGTLQGVVEKVSALGSWALGYWWLFAILGGVFAAKFGGDIIKQRLEDHRSAVNMRQ